VDVDGFDTTNSEFHLDHVRAQFKRLNIFELEISKASQVTANHLNLVFLSTHTADADHLQFSGIPTEKAFSKEMNLHSASPDRLEPLPFHAMSRYPYMPPEHYPRTRELDRYRSEFNTRLVRGPVPMLEQALLHAPYARTKR